METLTAFVRERAPRKRVASEESLFGEEEQAERRLRCPTDIQAALTVIGRRDKENLKREFSMGWRIDLRHTDLRRVSLRGGLFQRAEFSEANLEGADFGDSNLRDAEFIAANLSKALFYEAVITGATFLLADLRAAHIRDARLDWVDFKEANLEGVNFTDMDLRSAYGLVGTQLAVSIGSDSTLLPEGVDRPDGWPPLKT